MIFNKPCHLTTKAKLRDEGFFHFIEPAPIAPSRQLKIEARTKVDISGDFDTKVQATSLPMLSAIAEDTKAAVDRLPAGQQFLFFGSTTDQCDAQVAAYKSVGLNVEPYHNGVSSWHQKGIMGYTEQYVHVDTGWTARFLRFFGAPEYQTFAPPPTNAAELIDALNTAGQPTHVMLRRVYDSYREKIEIAPVGFHRDGKEFIFDNATVVTEEWLRGRAHARRLMRRRQNERRTDLVAGPSLRLFVPLRVTGAARNARLPRHSA